MKKEESRDENLKLLKALSEESRYRIVEILINGERCACEIPSMTGLSQPNTSMQLSKLKDLGMIQSRREGKKMIYSIKDPKVYHLFKSLGYNLKNKEAPNIK